MSLCVVYPSDEGGIAIAYPCTGVSIEEVVARVPAGLPSRVVDVAALPQSEDYRRAWTLDFEDSDSVVTVNPTVAAEIDRESALADLEDWFREVTQPGFATAGGWRLGLTQQDVLLLTGYYVLAKEAAALGGDIPPIIDMAGVPHTIAEIEELTAIMLAYGQRRAEISAEYAAKRAAILEG